MGNSCTKKTPDVELEIDVEGNSCPSTCCQFEELTCCVFTKQEPKKHTKHSTPHATPQSGKRRIRAVGPKVNALSK